MGTWAVVVSGVKAIILAVLEKIGLIMLGAERERRKKAEADRDVAQKQLEVSARPDVDDPFGRMRDKDG